MRTMSVFSFLVAASLATASCGNTNTSAQVASADTLKTIPFTNGVSDANKGMRKGEMEVMGQLTGVAMQKIYLYATYGKVNTKIDSSTVVNGKFSFGKDTYEQGFYMIGPNDNNLCAVILNPEEKVVELAFRGGKMDAGMSAVNSKENEAWAAYLPKEVAFQKQIKDLRVAGAKATNKVEFDRQVLIKEIELAEYQKEMIGKYPNTHFAKVVTWKQEPSKSDAEQFWSNIDFTDRSLLHSLVLGDRIQNFMRGFSKGEQSGFINCIGVVAKKADVDEMVYEFALNQMLVGFYESGMETISTYIIDNYVSQESCGDGEVKNIIQSTAESIQRLGIGATPPNIVGTDAKGNSVDLLAMAKKNKYTLVIFWSSWCEHCKGEAPEVKQSFDQWHAKGFEILGYSVDTQKSLFDAALTERGFTFPNICGMKQWDSPAAKDYRVTKTPAFYLIDKNGKIVLKPKGIREVNAFLAKNLK
jgi:thiol-disulfide isomerase/thioredoxin